MSSETFIEDFKEKISERKDIHTRKNSALLAIFDIFGRLTFQRN